MSGCMSFIMATLERLAHMTPILPLLPFWVPPTFPHSSPRSSGAPCNWLWSSLNTERATRLVLTRLVKIENQYTTYKAYFMRVTCSLYVYSLDFPPWRRYDPNISTERKIMRQYRYLYHSCAAPAINLRLQFIHVCLQVRPVRGHNCSDTAVSHANYRRCWIIGGRDRYPYHVATNFITDNQISQFVFLFLHPWHIGLVGNPHRQFT
jgi:hypothetical protein